MFAHWAFKIGWEGVTFIDIAADLAHPATFTVLGLFGNGLWFRFDVFLIIIVGDRWLVGQHLGIQHIGDEHSVGAEVDALGDSASQIGVGVLRDVKHVVDGTVLCLTIGKLVHLPSTLETEVFKYLHRCLDGQHADVEDTGILNKIMSIVALVDRHSHLQRVASDLDHRVHDAAVVDVVVVGGQHIEAVTNIE